MALGRHLDATNDRILKSRNVKEHGNVRWLDSEAAELYRQWKRQYKSFRYRNTDWEDISTAQKNEFRKAVIIRRKRESNEMAKDNYNSLNPAVRRMMV